MLLATFGAVMLAGGCARQPPAADYLWQAVSTKSDAQGTHDFAPHSDGEWNQLRQNAIVLVESANLLAVPGRRVAHGATTIENGADLDVVAIQKRLDTQHDQLLGFTGAFRDISLTLLADIDRKDTEAIVEHGGALDEVCEACHKVFWYPDQSQPTNIEK